MHAKTYNLIYVKTYEPMHAKTYTDFPMEYSLALTQGVCAAYLSASSFVQICPKQQRLISAIPSSLTRRFSPDLPISLRSGNSWHIS